MTRVAVALALTLATAGLAAAQEPLAVHVAGSSAKAATKEGEAQLKEKKDAASKSFLDLQSGLKKQHGKKMDAWPADKQAELGAARDAFIEAYVDWFYSSGIKQKDLDDSVREVSEALGISFARARALRRLERQPMDVCLGQHHGRRRRNWSER